MTCDFGKFVDVLMSLQICTISSLLLEYVYTSEIIPSLKSKIYLIKLWLPTYIQLYIFICIAKLF